MALIPTLTIAQASCSNFWQYVNTAGQTEGILTLTLDNRNSDHNLEVILTIGTTLSSVSI